MSLRFHKLIKCFVSSYGKEKSPFAPLFFSVGGSQVKNKQKKQQQNKQNKTKQNTRVHTESSARAERSARIGQ